MCQLSFRFFAAEYVLAKVTQHPLVPSSLSTLTQDGGQDNNMHKDRGISRLDSFIMYVKKGVLQLLTDC